MRIERKGEKDIGLEIKKEKKMFNHYLIKLHKSKRIFVLGFLL